MKKSIFLAFIASFAACAVHAESVTPAMAMAAANAWAERNAQFETGNNATNVITECDTNAAQTVLWHQVSMAGGGCLVVAPVTEIEPVVVALERDPGKLPAAHPLRGILSIDMRRRLRFLKLYAEDAPSAGGRKRLAASASREPEEDGEKAAQREAVRQEWAAQQQSKWGGLLSGGRTGGGKRLAASMTEAVLDKDMKYKVVVKGFQLDGPLTHWSQSEGIYNRFTPGSSVCGCVATATAAMLQFFRAGMNREIPSGKSNPACTYNGAPVATSTKGGKYDWASLPKSWGGDADGPITDEGKDLLGTVAYDAGVAVGMQWTTGSSGAMEQDIATGLRDYFGFVEVRCVNNPRQDQYEKLIYTQCRANAPVGLGIEAHSVVAVGYGVDEDDVERVRVFMGWGGMGDGWYALPYINTKSTEHGASYLSTIVDCVITMIGCDDDKVVPVCGRFLPYINPDVTIGGTTYTHDEHTFTNGFFGARVSASETQANRQVDIVTSAGKSGSVTVGPIASKDTACVSSGDAICKWVPDPIFFPLLNSEVALSFADAREKCIASFETPTNKPVFAFSGNWGEPATDAAWNYLYWLDTEADDATKEAFTNKYVVLCVPYSLGMSSESDGNPSIGVFDGSAISTEANKIWSFYNGRLAYWSIGGATYTNDVDAADFPYTNWVESASGEVTAGYSFTNEIDGVTGEGVDYVTGELITNVMECVMAKGYTNFHHRASGISLVVTSNCPGGMGEITPYGYGGPYKDIVATNVSEIAVTNSTLVATNSAGNVEFRCTGWTISSTNTPEVSTVELPPDATAPAVATISTFKDGAYTLTWLWETNAVKITTVPLNDNGDPYDIGVIEPGTGWYTFGDTVTFVATGLSPAPFPWEKNYFQGWVSGDLGQLAESDDYSESGNMVTFTVMRPVTLKAAFRTESEADLGTFDLTVKNFGVEEGDDVPATLVGGTEVPYDTATNLCRIATDVALSGTSYIDGNGVRQTCLGWMLQDEEGYLIGMLYTDFGGIVYMPADFYADSKKGGVRIYGNDLIDPETGAPLEEYEGYRVYGKSDTSPLSWVGVNPNAYGITNGASVTLTWLWKLPEEDAENEFEIEWNDDLDNLAVGYTTNLLDAASMMAKGWSLDDITVTVPVGWTAEKSLDSDGNVVATLALDEDALQAAMDTCELTVYPNADGTYTVEATIADGLRGFYYVLYGSDDLATWEAVASGTYENGTPCAQAQGTPDDPYGSVNLSIVVTPGDTAAGVKRFYKVVSGATSTPLTTY